MKEGEAGSRDVYIQLRNKLELMVSSYCHAMQCKFKYDPDLNQIRISGGISQLFFAIYDASVAKVFLGLHSVC